MKFHHMLPTAIAMMSFKDNFAFGLGQVSIIAFQLAGTDIPHDAEQVFDEFDQVIKGFYSGALTSDVVTLSETIADSVDKINGDTMNMLAATRFKQILTDLREHVAHHDTGGDFMGKLVKTTKTMSMLDQRIQAINSAAGDADKHLDALRPQSPGAGDAAEQREAA